MWRRLSTADVLLHSVHSSVRLGLFLPQDAREAREESRRMKAELAAAEEERAVLVRKSAELETANRLLRLQLADTTSSFRAAMATAQTFLDSGAGPV